MLGTQLLYKFERPQYADVLANHPDTSMSQIYGAPHLLRLFGKNTAVLIYNSNKAVIFTGSFKNIVRFEKFCLFTLEKLKKIHHHRDAWAESSNQQRAPLHCICRTVQFMLYICCYKSFAWTCFHHLMHLAEAKRVLLTLTLEPRKQEMRWCRCWSLFLKVRIGAMLAYTPLDEKSLALLLSYLQDFLKWVFARPTFVLLLAYLWWERVKCCLLAGILWRTLRHFSMPVTTRWLLQNTTARPFKRLLYFTTWCFWVFKSVWSRLSQLWGCDSTTSLHGLMEGRKDGWRRKNPGK